MWCNFYIKENEFEEVITLLETRLDKEDNGDLYYVRAQVYKYINKKKTFPKFEKVFFVIQTGSAYFATRSNHLTIDSITTIDSRQAPTNTAQVLQMGVFI